MMNKMQNRLGSRLVVGEHRVLFPLGIKPKPARPALADASRHPEDESRTREAAQPASSRRLISVLSVHFAARKPLSTLPRRP